MPIFARAMFGLVDWAARRGFTASPGAEPADELKHRAQRTGVRGETYAYWFLRRHGYVMIARNFKCRGMKGEVDLVGYDGKTLAFVEVKTRTAARGDYGSAEDAVTAEKRRHLGRMARQFVREYRVKDAAVRFDILAIEAQQGRRPVARLHRGAFVTE
jgi:putative endonuclease